MFSPYLSRRGMLRSTAAGVLGLSLPNLLKLQAAPTRRGGRAKNVLVILEQGGLSHIDTWDPKPDVVAEHRSPHRPIATSVAGMHFTELLPHTARIAHKLAVVRSMHHAKPGANGHPDGTQYVLSGSHPRGAIEMPDLGSVAGQVLGSPWNYLPPYIMVPGNNEQASSTRTGFLPASTRVFKTGGRDLSDPTWRVGAIQARPENAGEQMNAKFKKGTFIFTVKMNIPFSSPGGSSARDGQLAKDDGERVVDAAVEVGRSVVDAEERSADGAGVFG